MKKYSDIRKQLSTGDVVLFHRQLGWRGCVGWLISHITGSPFTHCGMILCFDGRILLVEAREGVGVSLRPLSDIKKAFRIFKVSKEVSDKSCLNIRNFLISKLGRRYDWLGAGLTIFRIRKKNRRWFCSEFVAGALEAAFYSIKPVLTPADINNYLEKKNIENFWVEALKNKRKDT